MELRSQAKPFFSLLGLLSGLPNVENRTIVFYIVSGEIFIEHHALIIMNGP